MAEVQTTEQRHRPRRSQKVAALFMGFSLLSTGCSESERSSNPASLSAEEFAQIKPETTAEGGAEAFYFATMEEMAATSDLIVVGTVAEVSLGRESGTESAEPEPEADTSPKERVRDATISVQEVLKGPEGREAVLEEYGFDRSGQPYEMGNKPWSLVGDRGIFFLIHGDGQATTHYSLVNSDGRVLFEDSKSVSFGPSPVSESLRNMTAAEAEEAVRAAVARAQASGMEPQTPYEVREREYAEDSPDGRGPSTTLGPSGPTSPEETSPSETTLSVPSGTVDGE